MISGNFQCSSCRNRSPSAQRRPREIRAFAHNGGIVVADSRTGPAERTLPPPGKGQLDELFGIAEGPGPGQAATHQGDANEGAWQVPGRTSDVSCLPTQRSKTTTGKALGRSGRHSRHREQSHRQRPGDLSQHGYVGSMRSNDLNPRASSVVARIDRRHSRFGEDRSQTFACWAPDGKRLPGPRWLCFKTECCELVGHLPRTRNWTTVAGAAMRRRNPIGVTGQPTWTTPFSKPRPR